MPELPEVEIVKQSLDKNIKFKKIKKVIVRNRNLRSKIPKNFETLLKNKNVEKISRFSKYIILHLSDGIFCIIHLGMSGTIHLVKQYKKNKLTPIINASGFMTKIGASIVKDHNIKAILQVHIDTASGVVNDLQAIRQAIDDADHPALLVVDAIASLGIAPLEMDSWGVDVTLSASQKGLMMTPGLGFIAANNKAIEISKSAKLKTGYWDWNDRIEGPHYKKYCGTAPIHLMMGLRKSLDLMLEETMEGIWTRHEHLAAATRRSIEVWSSCGELSFNLDQLILMTVSLLSG